MHKKKKGLASKGIYPKLRRAIGTGFGRRDVLWSTGRLWQKR